MDTTVDVLGKVATLQSAAILLTTLIVNGITMSFPLRASWLAWSLAMGFGIFFSGVAAVAAFPPETVWSMQLFAQLFILGIIVGSSAAGVNASTRKADETRMYAAQDAIAEKRKAQADAA